MTRSLVLSKHRSAGTFVDFSSQSELKLENLYRPKSKLHWDRSQESFCLRELLVSSNLDLREGGREGEGERETANFILLILLDNDLTLS